MDKIIITKKMLKEMLSADNSTKELYYQAALEGRVEATEQLAIVAFLLELISYKTEILLNSDDMKPFHFFGIPSNPHKDHAELLERTNIEIAISLAQDLNVPDRALVEFASDYAFFLFWQGRYFKCLGHCQNVLARDPNSFLCNFIKAAIAEICLINETNDAYSIALLNYQKSLIERCDEEKPSFDKTIFEKVRKIIYGKYDNIPEELRKLHFDLVPNDIEEAKNKFPEWTDEHAFCMRHHLFLNPLCDFDPFVQATNEKLSPLPIDEEKQAMFDELLEDYKLCRSLTYAFHKGINNVGKREMSMVYSYAYSIFDKLAYLLAHLFDLKVADNDIYFTKKKLFDRKIKNTDIRFGDIKNINIYPLLCIANEGRNINKIDNTIQTGTYEVNELRNEIDHKSLYLVKEEKLKRNSTILLGLVRRGILHTYMLLRFFNKDEHSYVEPSALGTTYMQAISKIIEEKKESEDNV